MKHVVGLVANRQLICLVVVGLGALLSRFHEAALYKFSLRSSAQAELLVPRTRTVIRQRRAFSVAGPTAWNGLPVALRLTPVAHLALFLCSLKTTLFDRGWAGSAPE